MEKCCALIPFTADISNDCPCKSWSSDLKTFIENIEFDLIHIDEKNGVFLKIGSFYNFYKNPNETDELIQYLLYRNMFGYIKISKLYASDFNVPQNRRRVLIFGIKKDYGYIPTKIGI